MMFQNEVETFLGKRKLLESKLPLIFCYLVTFLLPRISKILVRYVI